eukprot:GHVU01215708.1.p5 GENE.GHVU01215708.1~~GHVU01215708.1.p5  ORF type:complete len:102 (+),score=12.58 GHVU01215708.1:1279-1584(+)
MYMSYAGKNAAGPATRVENDNGSAGDSSYRSGTRRRIRRIGKEHANAAESLESSFDISRRLWATFRYIALAAVPVGALAAPRGLAHTMSMNDARTIQSLRR